MKIAAVASLVVVLAGSTPPAQIGVAWRDHERTVLAMSGPALAPGTKLTLVSPEPPQRVEHAVVRRTLESDPDLAAKTPGPHYEIVSASAGKPLPQLAIALVGEHPARRVGSTWSLRLDSTLTDVRARVCTSMEGLHLTLWSGKPLQGRRLWHEYHYLGYDLEQTCRPADTRDDG